MKKIIAIVGLPRSGTTLLTAILDSHPEIECWYEIFGSRKDWILPVYKNFKELYVDYLESIGIKYSIADLMKLRIRKSSNEFLYYFFKRENDSHKEYPFNYFVIKEVNTFPEGIQKISGIEYVDSVLGNISKNDNIPINVIWLYRDFRHVYLSKIEGYKKWWGDPEFQSNQKTYNGWLNEAYSGIKLIQNVCLKYNTYLLSYESLMNDYEKNIRYLIELLDIPFSDNMMHYNDYIEIYKINGDLNLLNNPQLPNIVSIQKRDTEWEEFSRLIYPLPSNIEQKEQKLLNFQNEVTNHPIQQLFKKEYFF